MSKFNLLLLICISYISAGCTAHFTTHVLNTQHAPSISKVLVLEPVDLAYPHQLYEERQITHVILDYLSKHSPLYIITPWEFQYLHQSGDPLRKTDLLVLCNKEGWSIDELIMLKIRIEKRIMQTGGKMLTQKGYTAGHSSSYQAEIETFSTLKNVKSGSIIAEFSALTIHDPFAQRPAYDPIPALRKSLFTAVRPAINVIQQSLPKTQFESTQERWQANLADLLQAKPPLSKNNLDDLQHAMQRIAYIRPSISVKQISQLFEQPTQICCFNENQAPTTACLSTYMGKRLLHPCIYRRLLASPKK